MKQLSESYIKMLFVLKTTMAICIPNKKNIKSGFTKNAQHIRNKVLLKHTSSTHCIKKIPLLHKEIYIQRNDKVLWTNCISPNSEKKSASDSSHKLLFILWYAYINTLFPESHNQSRNHWSLQYFEATDSLKEQFLISGMCGFKSMIIRS